MFIVVCCFRLVLALFHYLVMLSAFLSLFIAYKSLFAFIGLLQRIAFILDSFYYCYCLNVSHCFNYQCRNLLCIN